MPLQQKVTHSELSKSNESFLERASDAQPEQRRHHLQPQPGAPEGDQVSSRKLHLRGQQRGGGRGFESRCHHHHV